VSSALELIGYNLLTVSEDKQPLHWISTLGSGFDFCDSALAYQISSNVITIIKMVVHHVEFGVQK